MPAAITSFDQTKIGRNLESYYNLLKLIGASLKTENEEFVNDIVNILDDTIFNAASTQYFRSNLISETANQQLTDGEVTLDDLCKQHRYPRKLSTAYIFDNICNWNIDEFREEIIRLSVYDLTTSEENQALKPFQKSEIFNMDKPLEPYDKLGIKMVKCDRLKGKRKDEQQYIYEEKRLDLFGNTYYTT